MLLAGTAGIAQAADLLARIRAAVPGLLAAEYVDAAGLALVRDAAGLPAPLPAGYQGYLLAELAGTDPAGDADSYLQRLALAALPPDTAIAQDAAAWPRCGRTVSG